MLRATMAEALPRKFGDYVLERRLGVGGMAETFVARRRAHELVEQRVCLKRVLPAFSQDPDFVRQFEREARLAGRLRHNNIVGVIDFGAVDGELYMGLELVEGVDLRALMASQGGKLDPEVAALVTLDLAYALEYAHENGVVHRDVTPSNVLLSLEGEVKLADFGVAKALDGATIATASGFIKGKVPYMAPEQMRGGDVDGRADLFSVGITLYQMLAGRRPFVGSHDVEVMMKVLEGNRPPLVEVSEGVPEALVVLTEKLLELDPKKRPEDAGELPEMLAPVLGATSIRERLARLVREAHGSDPEPEVRDTALAAAAELRMGHGDGAVVTDTERDAAPEPAPTTDPFGATQMAPAASDDASEATTGPTAPMPEPATVATPSPIDVIPDAIGAEEAPALPGPRPVVLAAVVAVLALGGVGAAFAFSGDDPVVAQAEVPVPDLGAEPTTPDEAIPTPTEPVAPVAQEPVATMVAAMTESPATEAAVETDGAMRESAMAATTPTMAETMAATMAETMAATMVTPETMRETMRASMAETTETNERAHYRVNVFPWGEVWLGMRYMGRAPLTLRLSPGRHQVNVGQMAPSKSRTVRVRTGRERETLEFDL